jgi:hypothetical protein
MRFEENHIAGAPQTCPAPVGLAWLRETMRIQKRPWVRLEEGGGGFTQGEAAAGDGGKGWVDVDCIGL